MDEAQNTSNYMKFSQKLFRCLPGTNIFFWKTLAYEPTLLLWKIYFNKV